MHGGHYQKEVIVHVRVVDKVRHRRQRGGGSPASCVTGDDHEGESPASCVTGGKHGGGPPASRGTGGELAAASVSWRRARGEGSGWRCVVAQRLWRCCTSTRRPRRHGGDGRGAATLVALSASGGGVQGDGRRRAVSRLGGKLLALILTLCARGRAERSRTCGQPVVGCLQLCPSGLGRAAQAVSRRVEAQVCFDLL